MILTLSEKRNTKIDPKSTVDANLDDLQEKMEQLEVNENSLKFVKECKENIEILRKESMALSLLLANVNLPLAQDLQEKKKKVPLLSNK